MIGRSGKVLEGREEIGLRGVACVAGLGPDGKIGYPEKPGNGGEGFTTVRASGGTAAGEGVQEQQQESLRRQEAEKPAMSLHLSPEIVSGVTSGKVRSLLPLWSFMKPSAFSLPLTGTSSWPMGP